MRDRSRARRLLQRAAVTATVVSVAAAIGVASSPGVDRVVQAAGEICDAQGECGAGGEFQSLPPTRLLDTRDPGDALAGRKRTAPLGSDVNVFELQIAGRGGLPGFIDRNGDRQDDNVLAVALNITVVNPTHRGYLRAFGSGAPEGTTAIVNFTPGANVPNSAVLRPGRNGKLSLRVVTPQGLGRTDVVVDMTGWFSTSSYEGGRGARLIPHGPTRLHDSREPSAGPNPLSAGEQVRVRVRGRNGVPDNGNVVGALVNVSAVNRRPGSTNTYLSVLPDAVPNGTRPGTATVNVVGGQVRSALAMLPLGADGSIHVYNRAGETDVTVDLVAYLQVGHHVDSRKGRVVPLVAPFRAFDTRDPAHAGVPLPPGAAEDWSFADFANDVRIGSDPVGPQLGLIGNLTGARLERQYSWVPVSSYVTAYPSDTDRPTTANLTLRDGDVVPNQVLLDYGSTGSDPYRVRFYNRGGFLDYVLDVSAVILAD